MNSEVLIVATNVALTAIAFFIVSAIAQIARLDRFWGLVALPFAFFVAYYEVYKKFLPYPVVGSINKVIWIAVAGFLLGLLFDALKLGGRSRYIIYLLPVATAFYVGWVRIEDAPATVALTALSGVLFLASISQGHKGKPAADGANQHIQLAVAALGFAPLALLGASSSGFQLLMIFAFSLMAVAFWPAMRARRMGYSILLGAQGGMFALACTVILITQKIELSALFVLLLLIPAPWFGRLIVERTNPDSEAIRHAIFAGLCLLVALAAIALAVSLFPHALPF